MPYDPAYYQQLLDYRQQREAQRQQNKADKAARRAQQQAERLSAEYQQKLLEANQKNEQRYLDILQGRTDTKNRVLGDLKDWGQSQINDANDRYQSLQSQMLGDIYSRGFGGSPSMLAGAKRSAENARDRELNRINDDIINRRTNADAGLSDSLYSFMERRNDVPPDLSQLIALQQGLGRTGPILNAPGYGQGMNQGGQPQLPGFLKPGLGRPPGFGGLGAPPAGQPSPISPLPIKPGLPPTYPLRPTPFTPVAPDRQQTIGAAGMNFTNASLSGFAPPPPQQVGPPSLTQLRQADTMNTPGSPLLPWQGANGIGVSPGSKTPAMGAGYQPLYQQMPALGIFGAGVQMMGSGGDYGYPYFQVPSPYQGRTPLWSRDATMNWRRNGILAGAQRARNAGARGLVNAPPAPNLDASIYDPRYFA